MTLSAGTVKRKEVFFLPWQGEFGHYITTFVRAVHTWPADKKVVACRAGECCLFPSADAFYHNFRDLAPDRKRVGSKSTPWVKELLRRMQEKISLEHPEYREHEFVMPFMKYHCYEPPQSIVQAHFQPKISTRDVLARKFFGLERETPAGATGTAFARNGATAGKIPGARGGGGATALDGPISAA